MLVDWYLWIVHLDRRMHLNLDLGPLHIHLYARAVFFMWITVAILVIGGIAVFASRKRELIQKWTTWVLIAPIVGIPVWIGRGPTAAERPLPVGGMASSIAIGPRADRRTGLCTALGAQR
jgi:phosphatidate cytidylyltransferase